MISTTVGNPAADPGGGQGGHAPPPVPVKTSHKKDGRLICHVSFPPPNHPGSDAATILSNIKDRRQ